MERGAFLRVSCLGCAGLALGKGMLSLSGCASLPMVRAEVNGREISVPSSAFTEAAKVIVRAGSLPFDLLVTKLPGGHARCVYLRCTHEDQPLTATTTGSHCPSHGSRFALDGTVEVGPATTALRTYAVRTGAAGYIIDLGA